MGVSKKIRVQVRKDHLSKVAAGGPETALAELVWNALDADATCVDIALDRGPLGLGRILVTDNGSGFPFETAETLFVSLGGSWKAARNRTIGGRFLHGKDGEGRFKAFVLGRIVDWTVVYLHDGQIRRYTIEGRAESLDEFALSEEEPTLGPRTGVSVAITEIHSRHQELSEETLRDRLTQIFASYLNNYPNIRLSIDGKQIRPDQAIKNTLHYSLNSIYEEGEAFPVDLDIVEWAEIREKELWFADSRGFTLERYDKQIRGIGDFGFSCYLKSPYFERLSSSGNLAAWELNARIVAACEQAVRKIKDFFLGRTLEGARDLLDKWKQEAIYPFTAEATTTLEIAERQIFDIVALNINQNLPDFQQSDKRSKAFQFRMLRHAIERSPEDLQLIITEVLQLPKQKQEELADLLRESSLASIIGASHLISDRLKFLGGLERLLFDPDTKRHLKERSQLHRIIAENTWFFGDAFSLSVDDQSLSEVLRTHLSQLGSPIIVDEPVRRLDGSIGIVDLMLSRAIPRNRSNELEHLVVELKAPHVLIGQREIEQVKSYAFAVAKDERFRGLKTRWQFWVISNDYNEYAQMELSQQQYEDGVIYRTTSSLDITVWIKTWSQLIQENMHRLAFVRQKLDYSISSEDALAHLRKTYAEYTQGVLCEPREPVAKG